MTDTPVLAFVRRCLLGLLALGTLSVSAELWLVGHFGDSNQLIPLVIAAIGAGAVAAVAIRPRPGTLRLLQFTMLCYAGAGLIGISMHYQANAAAMREADPSLAGSDLFWRSVRSAAPPALAPGILVQLGLLGLAYTYRHPSLAEKGWGESDARRPAFAQDVEAIRPSHVEPGTRDPRASGSSLH